MHAAHELTDNGTEGILTDLPVSPASIGEPVPERLLVLVAEDENVTRMAVVDMLQEAGFDTVEASSGHLAMLALEENSAIRLLVTDIDMPLGIDGITLAACVHCRWPNVGIVMTSGKVTPVPGDLPSGAIFIPKPYLEEHLLSAVQRQVHPHSTADAAKGSRVSVRI